jgi:hypothetical protein
MDPASAADKKLRADDKVSSKQGENFANVASGRKSVK